MLVSMDRLGTAGVKWDEMSLARDSDSSDEEMVVVSSKNNREMISMLRGI